MCFMLRVMFLIIGICVIILALSFVLAIFSTEIHL